MSRERYHRNKQRKKNLAALAAMQPQTREELWDVRRRAASEGI